MSEPKFEKFEPGWLLRDVERASEAVARWQAAAILPPLLCSAGGFAYNQAHIDHWRRKAEDAANEIEGYKIAARDLNRLMQEARTEAASLRAALEQVSAVCADNSPENCDHQAALDFVRQVAVNAVRTNEPTSAETQK